MKKTIVLGLGVLITAVIFSGCGLSKTISQKAGNEIMEKTLEAQTGAKVDIDTQGEDVTIKTEDGQSQYSAGGQAKLPDNFPKELIVVDDARIILASSTKQSSSVSYTSNTEQDGIKEKYVSDLTGQGWEKKMDVDAGKGSMVNFAKGKMNVTISIGENDTKNQPGKSFINVVLATEEE